MPAQCKYKEIHHKRDILTLIQMTNSPMRSNANAMLAMQPLQRKQYLLGIAHLETAMIFWPKQTCNWTQLLLHPSPTSLLLCPHIWNSDMKMARKWEIFRRRQVIKPPCIFNIISETFQQIQFSDWYILRVAHLLPIHLSVGSSGPSPP